MKDDEILLPEMFSLVVERDWYEAIQNYAREAVRMNQKEEQVAVSEPLPFSLEAAKRGESLVTRDGRKARFVAHVPEASPGSRVIAITEGMTTTDNYFEAGNYWYCDPHSRDLFLAPKPKRTVWVNVYANGEARWSTDKKLAERGFDSSVGSLKLGRAVPIQIDDVGGEG